MIKEFIKRVSRKRTYLILTLSDFKKHECYSTVAGSGHSQKYLHAFGKLYSIMLRPHHYAPSFICIVNVGDVPACAVTVTIHNAPSKRPTEPEFFEKARIPLVFPNVEIMAFTLEKFREKGLARMASKKLLESIKFPVNGKIYVYSETMKRMMKKIKFTNVTNLHE